jgi:acyl carrier protein
MSSQLDEFYRRVAADIYEEPGAELTPDSILTHWDSLCCLHALIILDEVFDVAADPDKVKAAKTVGDLLAMVPA